MWRVVNLLQLVQVLGEQCESFVPSGPELRDDAGVVGWTREQLQGRRWSAAVLASGGGEELFEGYSAGRCVVGTWTKEEQMAGSDAPGLCLAKCQQVEGCLGILFGEVEGRQRPRRPRCFLAGVGRNDVLMEYPGRVVTSSALVQLAGSLQCWQKHRQRCVQPGGGEPSAKSEQAPSGEQERVAQLLSELRSRLKSLFRSVQSGHALAILSGVCRMLGRAADGADLAAQRCLRKAQSFLEGPVGTGVLCIIIFPIFGLLGQRLRRWQQQLIKWHAAKAAEKVHFSELVLPGIDVTTSSHQSVPTLQSSGLMPETPTPQGAQEPLKAAGGLVGRRFSARVMTPPRPRRLQLDQLDDESADRETRSPGRLQNAWKSAADHRRSSRGSGPSIPDARPRSSQGLPLLELLNHPDLEVVKKVRHIGEKTAVKIMSFRRYQGDLKTVRDLTKAGLEENLVKKVLKEYQVQ